MNLDDPHTRRELSTTIKNDINAYAAKAYSSGHRKHLGASIIGHECSRYLWSTFRWLGAEVKDGRQQRLLMRGTLEEPRFIEYLKAVGFEVDDRQARVSDIGGHFGGSLDAIATKDGQQFICEFKTKGTGPGFVKLTEKGVALSTPQHWGQMCVYGYKLNIPYGIYMSVNKNDDDLHVEVVKLDFGLAADLIRKAEQIVGTQKPPQKVSNTSTYMTCKWCHFSPICHEGAVPEKNCRSCFYLRPIAAGVWHCDKWNGTPSEDVVPTGCPAWLSIV